MFIIFYLLLVLVRSSTTYYQGHFYLQFISALLDLISTIVTNNATLKQKLKSIWYNGALATTGAISVTSK